MGAATMATLRDVRSARNWTMEKLASEAGVTFSTIARIEAGQVSPNPATRKVIAQALGVAVDDIDWPRKSEEGASDGGHTR